MFRTEDHTHLTTLVAPKMRFREDAYFEAALESD